MLSVGYVSDLQLIDNSCNQEPLETELLVQVEYDMDEQGSCDKFVAASITSLLSTRSGVARYREHGTQEGTDWVCGIRAF